MDAIDITALHKLVLNKQILWTEHLALRLHERGIKRADVIACIECGEIIEHYPDEKPFPSCLVLGASVSGEALHVVCGLDTGVNCYVVTAYYPSMDKWEADFKTRKAGE